MSGAYSFQTRARTIDHLGRGQIADAPTAISELWKNAYDAYARNVSLHVFASEPVIAAIFDDGVGMSQADVLERWLVIGTESKIEEAEGKRPNTLGLPERNRQGEKGIGRLSAAFLAPGTLLLTKPQQGPFVAVLVDWRLFENPFLALDDIRLPVEEFASADDVIAGLPAMVNTLVANLGAESDERGERLTAAWARFADFELSRQLPATVDQIRAAWKAPSLKPRHLQEWPTFVGLEDHGTAMFMIGVNNELAMWVRRGDALADAEDVKKDLRDTLTGFTDPFADPAPEFDYEVWIHPDDGRNNREISSDAMFGIDDLHGLEHWVDGRFDERGNFEGRVVAFGKDQGIQRFTPREPIGATGRDRLGAFRFCIGTFEQDEHRSTHDEDAHALLKEKAISFGGINVYRDDLRVMPYGREESDFLGIEALRGRHAGRYFWAHRRSFGRIAFTRGNNPNLKDKAGREGLVDNRARRDLRRVVSQLLIEFAQRFFGTDADLRKEYLADLKQRSAASKAAAEKARANRRKSLRLFLKEQKAPLDDAIQRLEAVASLAEAVKISADPVEATVLQSRYRQMLASRDGLRPPVVQKAGDLEDDYRSYSDGYRFFVNRLEDVAKLAAEVDATVGQVSAVEAARAAFNAHERTLSERLDGYSGEISETLAALGSQWSDARVNDRGEYRRRFEHLLSEKLESESLLPLLNLLDSARQEVEEGFAGRYIPLLGALRQLRDGIDLDSAFSATEDDRADLEDRLRDLQSVAQVGVTVEIIGHEFEALEGEVRRNLQKLPGEVKTTPAFKAALTAHQALADRLRFLAPMKIGGYRARETITGAQIADYVKDFFDRIFRDGRIEFIATSAFRSIQIIDNPARIYPVFINLVNNAVYWVSHTDDRQIRLDFVDGKVIVADSGPGVHQDDVDRLFDLFFTRRRFGRGVGLYLSRVNLAVAFHRIRYAAGDDPKILDGANFIIEFRGLNANV